MIKIFSLFMACDIQLLLIYLIFLFPYKIKWCMNTDEEKGEDINK